MEELKLLKNEIGWDIMDDTVCMHTESTVDPRIKSVTINFKIIKHGD